MKKQRFSEAQIVAILKQHETGQTVTQIIREHGISEPTAPADRFYTWKNKYGGMDINEIMRLGSGTWKMKTADSNKCMRN